MKKALDKKVLVQEAEYWKKLKRAVKENPGKTCRK